MVENFRKDLHQIPELGFNEFETQKYILNVLNKLKCEINIVKTGVVAYFNLNKPTTIGLRADIDGLPIKEENDCEYKSKKEGFMHACGHDGHSAMLLEIANYINDNLDKITNNIVLIFQPSEEMIGGSDSIINSGLIDKYNVKYIYGFHLWPGLEKGKIFSRPNELMAKSGEVNIKIIGKSVHAANSDEGIDALKIGVSYLNDLYEMEDKIDKSVFRLLKFGKMESGVIRNIISDQTNIYGTMRAYSDQIFNYMKNKLFEISKKYEELYNAKFLIDVKEGYNPVINDPESFSRVKDILDINILSKPVMQAEDFGNYQKKYKATFMFIGLGDVNPLHSSKFDFDSEVLNTGVNAYKKIINM